MEVVISACSLLKLNDFSFLKSKKTHCAIRAICRDWTYGRIRLLNVELPVKDIQQCEPEKWKAVACALQIKPCGSRSGESIICR